MAEKTATRESTEERTRRLAEKPFQELDAAAERSAGDGQPSLRGAAKSAAVTALAAAVAGALGGAAKAMLDRRDGSGDDAEDDEEVETSEPENAAAPQPGEDQEDQEDQEETEEPQAEGELDDDGEPEQDEDADAPLSRDEQFDTQDQEQDQEPEPEPDEQQEAAAPEPEASDDGRQRQREQGADPNEVATVVEQAKQQLRDVLGNEAESVSGLERTDGRWTVLLEVVEVRRIPESTDVLSSYEVVLDDDGGIVSMQRRHRYRRSQVEEG